jgi:Carboxypeptidase regulatory-like domain
MSIKFLSKVAWCAVLATALATAVFGQTDRGTITGTVIDPANALIPGATVTAHNNATGAEFKTDTTQTGNYTIPSLPAGIYSLSAEAAGFKKSTMSDIQVQVAQEVRQDIKLEVGSATESITVQAESVLLKTENAQQDQNISGDRINALPINFGGGGGATGAARDPLAFITLSPGVQQTIGVGGPSSPGGSAAVNGFGGGTYRVYLDGLDETSGNANARANETQGSVEQIEEYTLQTSNFAPEFGQITGGMVNYTTRSGTNKIHGSLYEYFVNEDLDAYRPFTYVNPESRKNDFGGSLGGPVWIPKIYGSAQESDRLPA